MADEKPEIVDRLDEDQAVQEAIRAGDVIEDDGPAVDTEEDDEFFPVKMAFVVFVDESGAAYGVQRCGDLRVVVPSQSGPHEVLLVPEKSPELDDMWRACAEVAKDIQVQDTARATVSLHMNAMRKQMEQLQAQAIAAQAGVGGGKGGLHVPRT